MKKIVLLCCTALLGIFLVACSAGTNSPEKTAEKFVKELYDNDSSAAMKLVYISEQKTGFEEMAEGKIKQAAARASDEANRKGGVKSITVTEKEVDDANGKGMVTIQVEFKNEGSTPNKERIRVIRHDDKWLVSLG